MDRALELRLEKFALQIRYASLEALKSIGFGHIGGILSIADTLAVIYGALAKVDPKNPDWPERDKVVLSKGHCAPALYSTLALLGFFPYETLKTLNKPGTNLPSHADRLKVPGVDMTAGSLGQGSSAAVGIALGDALKGRSSKTYLIVGDGELNEGQVWEAAMFTAAKKLHNIIWLIDWNKKQLDGPLDDILPMGDIRAKFEAFGFEAVTVNGNDVSAVYEVLSKPVGEKPLAVILDTLKGCGVHDIETAADNHSMTVPQETWDKWLSEVSEKIDAIKA